MLIKEGWFKEEERERDKDKDKDRENKRCTRHRDRQTFRQRRRGKLIKTLSGWITFAAHKSLQQ